jgi:hypothetical protein
LGKGLLVQEIFVAVGDRRGHKHSSLDDI